MFRGPIKILLIMKQVSGVAGSTQCPKNAFTCPAGSTVPCATKCDFRPECSGGEDEEDCESK